MQIPFQRLAVKYLDPKQALNRLNFGILRGYIDRVHPYIDTLEGMENIFTPIYYALFAPKLTFLPPFSYHDPLPSFSSFH